MNVSFPRFTPTYSLRFCEIANEVYIGLVFQPYLGPYMLSVTIETHSPVQ